MTNIDIVDFCTEGLVCKEPEQPVLSKTDQDQLKLLRGLRLDGYGAVHIKGKPRTGKTQFLAYISYLRKKHFGYHICTNTPFKPAIGDFTYFDNEILAEMLAKVNKALKEAGQKFKHSKMLSEEQNKILENLWKEIGIDLYESTTDFDEAQADADPRRAMFNKSIVMGYLTQQFGHYKNLLMMVSHSDNLLDRMRVQPFVTHDVNCGYIPNVGVLGTSFYTIYNRNMAVNDDERLGQVNPVTITLDVDGWKDLYDTNAPVGVPNAILKGLMKE